MRTERDHDEGWALISVLWVVLMLSMMAAATQALMVTSSRIEGRAYDRAKSSAAFEASIARAVLGISDPRIEKRWRVDGASEAFSFDGAAIRVSVQAELGRFDLNVMDGSMLRQLLQSAGLTDRDAENMADRILDWRSTTDLEHLRGATDVDYAAAGLPYRQRHGEFQSVAELQMVLGMTPDLYARIRPALTVYTHRSMIDPEVATPAALAALNFNNIAPPEAQTPQSHPGVLDPNLPLGGQAFSVTVQSSEGHGVSTRRAVVELTGDPERPYIILAWE